MNNFLLTLNLIVFCIAIIGLVMNWVDMNKNTKAMNDFERVFWHCIEHKPPPIMHKCLIHFKIDGRQSFVNVGFRDEHDEYELYQLYTSHKINKSKLIPIEWMEVPKTFIPLDNFSNKKQSCCD